MVWFLELLGPRVWSSEEEENQVLEKWIPESWVLRRRKNQVLLMRKERKEEQ